MLGLNASCSKVGGMLTAYFCRPGLETFAAVSCLQFVVDKTTFVCENVNQYSFLPVNKLLIINFSTEKKKNNQGL